jgi:hypothetical protein
MINNTLKLKQIIVLLILVLCLLGLSVAVQCHPNAAMRDVVPQFSGCAGPSGSVTSVSYTIEGHGYGHDHAPDVTLNATCVNGVYLVPVGQDYKVSWSAFADIYNYAPQQIGAKNFDGSNGCTVQTPVVSVSYTMQVALKTQTERDTHTKSW